MHAELQDGPLGHLWTLRRQLVRVVVHRGVGLRGWVEGRLQVYDKHLNMVLREATETYVRASGACADARWRRRTVGQLLIRGSCVVSIGPLLESSKGRPQQGTGARAAFRGRAALVDASGEAPAQMALAAAAAGGGDDDVIDEAPPPSPRSAGGAAVVSSRPPQAVADELGDGDGDDEEEDGGDDGWDASEHLEHFEEHYRGDGAPDASEAFGPD